MPSSRIEIGRFGLAANAISGTPHSTANGAIYRLLRPGGMNRVIKNVPATLAVGAAAMKNPTADVPSPMWATYGAARPSGTTKNPYTQESRIRYRSGALSHSDLIVAEADRRNDWDASAVVNAAGRGMMNTRIRSPESANVPASTINAT